MEKDTLRLLLFLDCNFKCKYCCNKQSQFNSQFLHRGWEEIDLSKYKNVCVSGGEPFLYPDKLFDALDKLVAAGVENIYIYTNGILIKSWMVGHLIELYPQVKCLNVGLHNRNQLYFINRRVGVDIPSRFMVQDIFEEAFLKQHPDRLNKNNTKAWTINDCNMPNEDWVLLKEKE